MAKKKKVGQRGADKKQTRTNTKTKIKRPRDWDKAIMAGYWRTLSATRKQAAAVVGIDERTLCTWEHATWWQDAQAEGRDKFFGRLGGMSLKNILEGLNDSSEKYSMAKWVADRIVPELGPPKQKLEHDIEARVGVRADVVVYMPDNERDPKETDSD